MLVASVALSDSVKSFDKLYDYRVPENMKLSRGLRVFVPFGASNKLRVAWVIRLTEPETSAKLKTIHEIVDESPVLTEEMLKLSEWIRGRYFCTFGDAIRLMVPSGLNLIKQRRLKAPPGFSGALDAQAETLYALISESSEGVLENELLKQNIENIEEHLEILIKKKAIAVDAEFIQKASEKTLKAVYPVIEQEAFDALVAEGKIKSIYPLKAMELLYSEGLCTLQDLLLIPGLSYSMVKSMQKKGWIEYTELEIERNPFEEVFCPSTTAPVSTEDQAEALHKILPLLETSRLNEVLLHGITGSGKTEVYLAVIQNLIEKGKTAIVLVPEISLTPQMTSRFLGRFGNRVAVQHSRLSLGERYDQWRKIKRGEVSVVVGARSAVFAPLSNLGAIIVDEEHEWTYKSEVTPKYDARHVARARCNINGALLLLGSATPSIESYFRAVSGKTVLCELTKRANALPLPEVFTVDMCAELESGNRSILSFKLENELIKVKEQGEQSILFLNRRGYAAFMLCRDCGYTLRCPRCSVSLTAHAKNQQAICHYCGYSMVANIKCPKCGGNHLKSFGTGTQKIEEELSNHPAGFRVLRMDMDTTGTKLGHQKLLDAFRNGEADILTGTQMVAKGHDFPRVTLVGILAADASLYTGDYRSSERTFQLITQAAGRAGRGGKAGKVILQTYNQEDYAITTAMTQDYKSFYEHEIAMRKALWNPPFCHIGLVMISGEIPADVDETAGRVHGYLMNTFKSDEEYSLYEPIKAPVYMLNNRARMRIIFKHTVVNRMVSVLDALTNDFKKLKAKGCEMSVDIDPASML